MNVQYSAADAMRTGLDSVAVRLKRTRHVAHPQPGLLNQHARTCTRTERIKSHAQRSGFRTAAIARARVTCECVETHTHSLSDGGQYRMFELVISAYDGDSMQPISLGPAKRVCVRSSVCVCVFVFACARAMPHDTELRALGACVRVRIRR